MANRADVNRLCSNLTQMGVEIKPEELQNLTRAICCRVMTDFVTVAFLASPELMNQQLAISLESCNVNSGLQPFHLNRNILWSEALALLSKGGASAFEFSDLVRPEAKKFNQLLQQMLKYLYHSAQFYEAVSEESARLEEVAERVERQREDLEFDKNELDINEQKIAQLHAANISQVFNLALEKKGKLTQETERINNEYTELKSVLEKNKNEFSVCLENLSGIEAQLEELQDLVVTNHESQVSALEQLRKEFPTKLALIASKEKEINQANSELELSEDKKQRAMKIANMAASIGTAIEEFQQNTSQLEGRIDGELKVIADLQSELGRSQASIESRNHQVKAIGENEQAKLDLILALEKEEASKKDQLAKCQEQKVPLTNDIHKLTQELSELTALAENNEFNTLAEICKKYERVTERWRNHLSEVHEFETECLKTENVLKQDYAHIVKLLDAINKLD